MEAPLLADAFAAAALCLDDLFHNAVAGLPLKLPLEDLARLVAAALRLSPPGRASKLVLEAGKRYRVDVPGEMPWDERERMVRWEMII